MVNEELGDAFQQYVKGSPLKVYELTRDVAEQLDVQQETVETMLRAMYRGLLPNSGYGKSKGPTVSGDRADTIFDCLGMPQDHEIRARFMQLYPEAFSSRTDLLKRISSLSPEQIATLERHVAAMENISRSNQ